MMSTMTCFELFGMILTLKQLNWYAIGGKQETVIIKVNNPAQHSA